MHRVRQVLLLLAVAVHSPAAVARLRFENGILPDDNDDVEHSPHEYTEVEKMVFSKGSKPPYNIIVPLPIRFYPFPKNEYNPFNLTIGTVRPVIDLVLKDLHHVKRLLKPDSLVVRYVDSEQSVMWGPVRVIEAFWSHGVVDCIIGFSNTYSLAPMARYASAWPPNRGLPLLTTIGGTPYFSTKKDFPLLTRVSPPYDAIGRILEQFLTLFNYRDKVAMLVQSAAKTMRHVKDVIPNSDCQFKLEALKVAADLARNFQFPTNPDIKWHSENERKTVAEPDQYYHQLLKEASVMGNR